jgi:hypothetical protein
MFGAYGLPYPGGMRGRQLCACDDNGFGRFVPSRRGLIKQTLSLNDLLLMLKHYIELIRNKEGIYVIIYVSMLIWKYVY